MKPVKSCSNCANAIFCAMWGEYKCEVFQRSIRQGTLFTETDCEHHKIGTPKESKANADYEVNLQD